MRAWRPTEISASPPRRGPTAARRTLLATLLLAGGLAGELRAQPTPPTANGRVVAEEPCAAPPPHDALDEFGRRLYDATTWERLRADPARDCRRIRYTSGGQDVGGYVVRPRATGAGEPLPAIVYNRGGTGNFGRIDALTLAELWLMAQRGFVVVASEYRYVDDQARRDEWGGADLDDVLNLLPLVSARPDVDARNVFMMGLSRGGFMTYLALARGARVNAAAVIAGPTDLARLAVERPEFVLGNEVFDGWAKLWPDYVAHARQLLESRSPVALAGRLDVPLLVMHARTDSKISVSHALAMAQKLQEHGKEYELVVYANDGHSLPRHREDRNRRIEEWFRAHMAH